MSLLSVLSVRTGFRICLISTETALCEIDGSDLPGKVIDLIKKIFMDRL